MEMPFKLRWNQILISLLIGLALGTAFGQWRAREDWRSRWKKGSMREVMLERFSKKLRLDADQKIQVKAIFDRKHPQMLALQSEMQPKFRALRETVQTEIRTVLRPEQQVKFDRMNAKMEERWKNREKFFAS